MYNEGISCACKDHYADFSLNCIQIGSIYSRQFEGSILSNTSKFYTLYMKYRKGEALCSLCKNMHNYSLLCLPECFSPHALSCLMGILEGKHVLAPTCDWIGFVNLAGYLMINEQIIDANIDHAFSSSPTKRYRHFTVVFKLYHNGYIRIAKAICARWGVPISFLQECKNPSKFYRKLRSYFREQKRRPVYALNEWGVYRPINNLNWRKK